jgi:hypothetical protein
MLTILTTYFINSNAAFCSEYLWVTYDSQNKMCHNYHTCKQVSQKRMTLAQTKHSNSYFYVHPNSEIIE